MHWPASVGCLSCLYCLAVGARRPRGLKSTHSLVCFLLCFEVRPHNSSFLIHLYREPQNEGYTHFMKHHRAAAISFYELRRSRETASYTCIQVSQRSITISHFLHDFCILIMKMLSRSSFALSFYRRVRASQMMRTATDFTFTKHCLTLEVLKKV